MAGKPTVSEKLPPPSLLEPREIARDKIVKQIEKGKEIRNYRINNESELETAQTERSKWSDYNTELLIRIFDNSSMSDEYNRYYGGFISLDMTLSELIDDFRKDMDKSILRLESIVDRIDLIPEANIPSVSKLKNVVKGQDVFLVHGHDDAAKEAVARYLERLGLKAIILHEQPNEGKTIIEKFETYSNVGFAVVLLTPDDVMFSKKKSTDVSEKIARARQNVVFELGYFLGKLDRQHVCALYKEGVDIPSDINGVLYVPMDTAGAWRLLLARELKQAGLTVDLNKAM